MSKKNNTHGNPSGIGFSQNPKPLSRPEIITNSLFFDHRHACSDSGNLGAAEKLSGSADISNVVDVKRTRNRESRRCEAESTGVTGTLLKNSINSRRIGAMRSGRNACPQPKSGDPKKLANLMIVLRNVVNRDSGKGKNGQEINSGCRSCRQDSTDASGLQCSAGRKLPCDR